MSFTIEITSLPIVSPVFLRRSGDDFILRRAHSYEMIVTYSSSSQLKRLKVVVTAHPGFVYNGRSGPKFLDRFLPQFGVSGSSAYQDVWFAHDLLAQCGLPLKIVQRAFQEMLKTLRLSKLSIALIVAATTETSKAWYMLPDKYYFCNCDKVDLEIITLEDDARSC